METILPPHFQPKFVLGHSKNPLWFSSLFIPVGSSMWCSDPTDLQFSTHWESFLAGHGIFFQVAGGPGKTLFGKILLPQ